MRMILTLSCLLMLQGASWAGTVVLFDDFNDGVLDSTLWHVNANIPQGSASVSESGGYAYINNRAHLVTNDEWDPLAVGGLRISGRFRFNISSDADFFQLYWRSNGLPGGAYGETRSGLSMQMQYDKAYIPGDSKTLHKDGYDTFDFEVTDDGTQITARIWEIGGQGRSVDLAGSYTGGSRPDNHVAVHNRERSVGHMQIRMDWIQIETGIAIPAPLAVAVGAVMFGTMQLRRRRKTHAG